MEFFSSFITVSVVGGLLSALLPSGGNGKSVKALVGFVICLSLLFLAADSFLNGEFSLPDFSFSVAEEISEDSARLAGMAIENAMEEQVADLIKKYTGSPPAAVDCSVLSENGGFILQKIKIYMTDVDRVSVFARLASELRIDYGLLEYCEVS